VGFGPWGFKSLRPHSVLSPDIYPARSGFHLFTRVHKIIGRVLHAAAITRDLKPWMRHARKALSGGIPLSAVGMVAYVVFTRGASVLSAITAATGLTIGGAVAAHLRWQRGRPAARPAAHPPPAAPFAKPPCRGRRPCRPGWRCCGVMAGRGRRRLRRSCWPIHRDGGDSRLDRPRRLQPPCRPRPRLPRPLHHGRGRPPAVGDRDRPGGDGRGAGGDQPRRRDRGGHGGQRRDDPLGPPYAGAVWPWRAFVPARAKEVSVTDVPG
jgi:hypothetical protein